jgi:MFS superfamily sulfate permease-like transporter
MSGLIAGIVGGIVISFFSGSELSVSGPAAGLAVIVLNAITSLGAFDIFLLAVVLGGLIQLLLGILRAGIIGEYVPNSVIRGMLAGIGVVIIVKQLPHLLGWDSGADLAESLMQVPIIYGTPLDPLFEIPGHMVVGPMIIGLFSLAFLILWDLPFRKNINALKLVPGPLVVVLLGTLLNEIFLAGGSPLALTAASGHLVSVPISSTVEGLLQYPNFSAISNPKVWVTAVTLAIVASIETLLSVEAVDKLDPEKRISDTSKELRAQGIGNTVSGLIGGLPITAVIVRSSTNVYAGGRTRLSAIVHGVLLLVFVLLFPDLLNRIPLATLAAILIAVGYKLTSLKVIRESWQHGVDQFIPFTITVLAIVFTDLLTGIGIGLLSSIYFVIRANHHAAITVINEGTHRIIRFNKDASFVNKAELKKNLRNVPDNCSVTIDASNATLIDHDIYDLIGEFSEAATYRGIEVDYLDFFGKRRSRF